MADVFAKSDALRRLSQWLAEQRDWPLRDRLVLVQRLARQVQALHQNGRIHRAISSDAVTVDEQLRPQLPPPAAPRRFGGDDSDPEFCPPELTGGEGVSLPEEIDAAAKALQEAGYTLDPRRIDLYQLGVLLCRLVTGEPILPYIYDATIKGRVPALARPLLERTLGFDSPDRFENCDRLIEALDEALRKTELLEAPTSVQETPAPGSIIVIDGDTPPQGIQRASKPQVAEGLPFERLGHFRILEQIGSGGMGDVYRGYDESLDRPVAIKVLPPQLARDADFVRRFHAEATAAASVAHPNVVPIYFIGEDGGHHFFAMQYVNGESLAERLSRQGHLFVDDALELITQCLAGLQAAHARGLIHRDVKPGNILIERETGRAMLVDFGLVRRLDESARMTATGVIMGTVDYIAPEQARGGKIDARADIYSLGVLFYQLLSGRLPFVAESPTVMIFQHAYEPPFPLEEAAPGLSPPVVQIVERMMAKDPDSRYPDCAAVLADVAAYRHGQPLAPDAWTSGFEDVCESSEEPALPEGLAKLLGQTRWQAARDWAATMFRRHTPEFIQELQGTTYQMDAAVGHYERRRNRLAKLLEEARSLEADLSEQIEANLQAAAAAASHADASATEHEKQAALAKKYECEENAAALRSQQGLQQQQVEDLEGQLSKADATLARLHSQQNVLKARLQAAVARRQLEGGLPRPKPRRWLIAAVVGGGVLGLVSLMLILPRSNDRPAVAFPAEALQYDDFANTAGLKLNGWARPLVTGSDGTVLHLTPSTKSTVGSVFSNAKVKVSRFSTSFAFRITNGRLHGNRGKGGGGFAFVVQPVSPSLVNYGAGGLGFPNVGPSVVVEFDTWKNPALHDPSNNHIGVDINGVADHGEGALDTVNVSPHFDDGNKWYAWIDYDGSMLKVWASQQSQRPVTPLIARPLDIPGILGQDTAYVGFTSGTGAATADHMILSWRYAEVRGDKEDTLRFQENQHVPVIGTKSEPPVQEPPKPNPKVPPEAALLMTFDKNTLLEVSGFVMAVRSLTGRYHGQNSIAQYVPKGKVGGAISIEDGQELSIPRTIINDQPEYTITAWLNRPDKRHLFVYSEDVPGVIFALDANPAGAVAVSSYNDSPHPGVEDDWIPVQTPPGAAPANQWVFVAVRLVKGGVRKGNLTVRVNNNSYLFSHQMVHHRLPGRALIGAAVESVANGAFGPGSGMIDEMAIYQRALSDSEIETLYQMGLKGESLGM